MNETIQSWIKSAQNSVAIVTALNIFGWLSILGGILGAMTAGRLGVLFFATWLICGVFLFAAAAVVNHLRQLMLLQLGLRPTTGESTPPHS